MDEIEAAGRAAASHEMIMGLQEGYNTRVGERGAGVSGGQRARIAIARALLRRPRVLVLDEATAVASAIGSAAADRGVAVLVIAHRLSSLRRANRVAVLSDGRIAEIGPFDELVAKPDSHLGRMVAASGSSLRPASSLEPSPPSSSQSPSPEQKRSGEAKQEDTAYVC
jgi:ABC-type multidrug transport system fused ATPase/permease subunit